MHFPLNEWTPSKTIPPEQLPFVSILIPTFNCSQSLSLTLDSLIAQVYPRYEIVVIDAGSTDRTLDTVHSYQVPIQLISASSYEIYRMINLGIAAAKGDYLNILFPGDFYIHPHVIEQMMSLGVQEGLPDLIYSGTLLRDHRTEVKFLFRTLELPLLKRGQQPTSLQACWFKKELFQKIGLFRTDYQQRGAFDLFCRLGLDPSLRYAALRRALVDYDLRWVTSSMVIQHFFETGKILYGYFGGWALCKWLVRQKDTKRFVKLWLKHLRLAFRENK